MFTFNFNHYVEEIQLSLQNPKFGGRDLPTKAHCDSVSIKSKSQRLQDNSLDCSFDWLCGSNHAQIVWEASLKHLLQSFKEKKQFSLKKRFNHQILFNFVRHKSNNKEKFNKQIILSNNLLKMEQKQNLFKIIQEEKGILNFIKQLSNHFQGSSLLNQMIFCIYKIQQKKTSDNKTKQIKQNDFIIPHFDYLYDSKQHYVIRFSSYEPFFEHKFSSEVIFQADKITDKIAQEIYFNNQIKYINLRNIIKQLQEIMEKIIYFKEFLKYASRSVYLILQGFFINKKQLNKINKNMKILSLILSKQIIQNILKIENIIVIRLSYPIKQLKLIIIRNKK